ncbi:MAG: IS30 family transposase, partial [Pyrinomonadaceae bacterium]
LKADFYFAHPYHSWERGLNENTNGLVRQYFPKKSEFSKITDRQITKVVDRLNNRPRKTLGYKTPNEVFFKLPLVALTT